MDFKAYLLKMTDNTLTNMITPMHEQQLSDGDVLIKTAYSSINYKDCLATNPNGGVIRTYPMIPGIDASGTVLSSNHDAFKVQDEVFVMGYEFGVSHTGGFSEIIRVPHTWVQHLPEPLSLKDVMIYGTAGLTAGLSVMELIQHCTLDGGPILVTGATGGVASIALAILNKIGFEVHALTRKKETEEANLKQKGAHAVFSLEDITQNNMKPLAKQTYQGIIDTVGGDTASQLIPFLKYNGVMTLCGQVGGAKLTTTVYPLILRAIRLIGIDAVYVDPAKRARVWEKLAHEWHVIDSITTHECAFEAINEPLEALKTAQHVGRTIIKF